MSAIDHAAAAVELIHGSLDNEGTATAQVHATLALVDELRTANLIAYQASKQRSLELETHIENAIAEALGVA